MKLFHLSHIDLDGYGSQFITKKIFKSNIYFENSNYGSEIKRKLENILKKIDFEKNEENTILITDLNLDEDIAKWIDDEVNKRDTVKLLLIDHHISGEETSKKYEWYNLNSEFCATYLTFLYFKELLTDSNEKDYLQSFVELVNITDLWKEEDPKFNKANFLSNKIFNSFRFPQMLNFLNHDFKLHIIEHYFNLIQEGLSIRDIENLELDIKEKFLNGKINEEMLLNLEESIETKYYYYIYLKLKNFNHEVFDFNGSKGKMIFDIGSGLFTYFAGFYNKEYNDVDFLFHVAYNGKISLRSKGQDDKNDVSKISNKYFGGGGHKNSSGGLLEAGIETKKYNKNEAISIINNLISSKN